MWCLLLTFSELFQLDGGLLVHVPFLGPPVIKQFVNSFYRVPSLGWAVSVSVLPSD